MPDQIFFRKLTKGQRPPLPRQGYVATYVDTDGILKSRDSEGVETIIGSGAGGVLDPIDYGGRKVIYVSKGDAATDTRTGLNKYDATKPFATIQAAIDAAASGDRIEVGPGVYTETLTLISGIQINFSADATLQHIVDDAAHPHALIANPAGGNVIISGKGTFVALPVNTNTTELQYRGLFHAPDGGSIIFQAKTVRVASPTPYVFDENNPARPAFNVVGSSSNPLELIIDVDYLLNEEYDCIVTSGDYVSLAVHVRYSKSLDSAAELVHFAQPYNTAVLNYDYVETTSGLLFNAAEVAAVYRIGYAKAPYGAQICGDFQVGCYEGTLQAIPDQHSSDFKNQTRLSGYFESTTHFPVTGRDILFDGVIIRAPSEVSEPVSFFTGNNVAAGLIVNKALSGVKGPYILNGTLMAGALPTSASGLPTGALYSDSGTLKVVP